MYRCKRLVTILASFILLFGVTYCSFSLLACLRPEWAIHAFPLLDPKIRMLPPFADIRSITAVAGCNASIEHIIHRISVGCDPYGRTGGLGYPPFIYYLARGVGLTGGLTNVISLLTGLAYILSILILSNKSILERAIGGLLLLSLPTQLGLERMNIDIALFIGLLLIARLRESSEDRFIAKAVITALLSFFCTASKIYLLFGICVWLITASWAGDGPKKLDGAILVGTVAGGVTTIPWLLSGDTFASPIQGLFSHGLIYYNVTGNVDLVLTAITTGFLLAGIWTAHSQKDFLETISARYSHNGNKKGWTMRVSIALSGLSTWLGCYILVGNWDYRFIFVFPWLLLCSEVDIIQFKWWRNRPFIGRPLPITITIQLLAALQLFSPLAYMLVSNIRGETMNLSDWLVNPIGMLVRHTASLTINLTDLAFIPFFAGSSLLTCCLFLKQANNNTKTNKLFSNSTFFY